MARQGAAAGEDNSPGNVGDPSVQFAVDEVAEPAEAESDRGGRGDEIGNLEEADLLLSAKIEGGEHCADQPAMEGHAPFPDGEDFERVGKIVRNIVKESIAEAGSDDQAKGQDENQVGDVVLREGKLLSFCIGNGDQVGGEEAEDIHESVPADFQGADLEDVRSDFGKLHGVPLRDVVLLRMQTEAIQPSALPPDEVGIFPIHSSKRVCRQSCRRKKG